MSREDNPRSPDKAGRNLIKAFTCAGAILGAGALGLAKAVSLFAEQLGWIAQPLRLGDGFWWILAGAVIGFLGSWLMVRLQRRP